MCGNILYSCVPTLVIPIYYSFFLEFYFVQSLNMVLFSDNTSEECIEDHTECYDEKKFRIVLDNLKETRNFGDYYVCIWGEHKTQEGFKFYHPDDFFSNKILPCGFEIDIKTTACLYTEPGDSDYFSTIGCQVLRESDNDRTWCACNHLSSFTGAVMPAVPRVDLTAAAFDPRVMYPVYVLLGSLWLTFFLLLLILRSKDKSDVEKVRIFAYTFYLVLTKFFSLLFSKKIYCSEIDVFRCKKIMFH